MNVLFSGVIIGSKTVLVINEVKDLEFPYIHLYYWDKGGLRRSSKNRQKIPPPQTHVLTASQLNAPLSSHDPYYRPLLD